MTNRRFVSVVFFVLSIVVLVHAQQPNRPTAPAATTTSAPSSNALNGKVAMINTAVFGDPKIGITRLSTTVSKVDGEFQTQRAELQKLQQQYTAILADIEKTKSLATPQELQRKADQAETLKRSIERKGEDAELSYKKRLQDAVEPLSIDIVQAMSAFAQKRGITLLLDASKLQGALLYAGGGVDVTQEFIAEYNQQKPGAALNQNAPSSLAIIR